MSFDLNTKKGVFASWALNLFPFIGTAKGIYEGCYGKDSITCDNLNGFQRSMCFLGALPSVGSAFKSLAKSEKVLKNFSKGAKVIKGADIACGAYDFYDSSTADYDN